MRKTILLAAALVLGALLGASGAEQNAPPLEIPVPPGAEVVTELNVDPNQLLQMAQDSPLPIKDLKIDWPKLKEALAPIKRIQYAEMHFDVRTPADKLVAFFEERMAGRRIIYDGGTVPGTGAVLIAAPDGGYFTALVDVMGGNPRTGRIRAARLSGLPDLSKAVQAITPALLGALGLMDPPAPTTAATPKKTGPAKPGKTSRSTPQK